MVKMIELGFYSIDPIYLKYLHSVDKEVYYSPNYFNGIKPFFGIVVLINEIHYFIPITSAKEKHRKWKNISDEHFLIYEIVNIKDNILGNIYKKYRILFEKEYIFLIRIKDKIITKINKLYTKQKENNMVRDKNCNFDILEKALNKWNKSI